MDGSESHRPIQMVTGVGELVNRFHRGMVLDLFTGAVSTTTMKKHRPCPEPEKHPLYCMCRCPCDNCTTTASSLSRPRRGSASRRAKARQHGEARRQAGRAKFDWTRFNSRRLQFSPATPHLRAGREQFPNELWRYELEIYHSVKRSSICDCSHCKSYTLVLLLMNTNRFLPLTRSLFLPRLYRRVGVPKSTTPFIFCMYSNAAS